MSDQSAERRNGPPRRVYVGMTVIVTGVVLSVALAVLSVLINLVLGKFLPPENALILAFAACLGGAVVVAMWATEGVIERQNAHVHAHLRKVASGEITANQTRTADVAEASLRGI